MPTNNKRITALSWTSLYTGPTDAPLTVEAAPSGNIINLVISSAATPPDMTGHNLPAGVIKNVTLKAGESLFAKIINPTMPNASAVIVITD